MSLSKLISDGVATTDEDDMKDFQTMSDAEIDAKRAANRNKNTVQKNKEAEAKFVRYLKLVEKLDDLDFYNFELSTLDSILGRFYWNIRTKDGNKYKAKTLDSFRHGLNRCIRDKGKNFDIIKSPEFNISNQKFKDACAELKKEGLGHTVHYPEIHEKGT